MKKVACAVLALTLAVFLVSPLPGEARGQGGAGVWWVPWAVLGGAAILAAYHYEHVPPPAVIVRARTPVYVQPATAARPAAPERVFIYPRHNQSEALQARDRFECHAWAVGQTGYDPAEPSAAYLPETRRIQMMTNYRRAQAACLDARGYTMK